MNFGNKTSGKINTWIIVGIVALVFVAGCVIYYVSTYNTLVTLQENVSGAWADVETTYQRRMDLIPNLVKTVKAAKEYEADTLKAVVEARAAAGKVTIDAGQLGDLSKFKAFQQAQDQLSSALSKLMVVVERYPTLKATENFRDLQVQLEGTENRITVARQRYNDSARLYNSKRRGFFAAMVANNYGFDAVEYFKAQEGASEAPEVNFD